MTTNSTSLALPEALRELTPQDQEEHAKKRLRELIEDGLSSGDGRVLTPNVLAELKARTLGGFP